MLVSAGGGAHPQAAVHKRLQAFYATATPVLAFYEKKGVLQRFTGSTSDEIYAKLKPAIAKLTGAA